MNERGPDYWKRVGRHIRPRLFYKWLAILLVPTGAAFIVFIQWHNALVGTPEPKHIILRMVVGLVAFTIVGQVLRIKAVRPAEKAAMEEIQN